MSDGTFVSLNYPAPGATSLAGINDNGMIVGNHSFARGSVGDGVVYHNGKWATLDYPGPSGTTTLFGISDAGVIVGESSITESGTAFLYEGGVFKIIAVPSSFATEVQGISSDGLITGYVLLTGNENSQHGFTARCK